MFTSLIQLGRVDENNGHPCRYFDFGWPDVIVAYIGFGICANVPVAGINHDGRDKFAADFLNGFDASIALEREPANEADRNAIRVIARWSDSSGTRHSEHIGYVPKQVARQIKKLHPEGTLGARLRAAFLPVEGRSVGLRIDIGRPPLSPSIAATLRKRIKRAKKARTFKPALTVDDFEGAISAARESGLIATFQKKVLRGIVLRGRDLSGMDFERCDLSEADLKGCTFRNANLTKAKLIGADVEGADFTEANMEDSQLNHANCTASKFHRANLKKAVLTNANLGGADLTFANLERTNLTDCELQEADLSNAILVKAKCRGSSFLEARLQAADLSQADFTDTEMISANLQGANLQGTRFWQADLGVTDLRGCDLSQAKLRGAWKEGTLTDFGTLYTDEADRPFAEREQMYADRFFDGFPRLTQTCSYCEATFSRNVTVCPFCGNWTKAALTNFGH